MLDWRTILLGVFVFAATFAGGWWIGFGSAVDVSDIGQFASAVANTVAPKPSSPATAKTYVGKGLTDDDHLRRAVILRSQAYQNPYCNQDPKTLYIVAATKYAEVLMRATGCSAFPRCRVGIGQLDRVWQLNRSALDEPVAEAMAAVHAAGGISEKDFRGDVGMAVRVIAGRDFATGPGPECISPEQQTSRWRIRIRR
jgi:hypothetical protein